MSTIVFSRVCDHYYKFSVVLVIVLLVSKSVAGHSHANPTNVLRLVILVSQG